MLSFELDGGTDAIEAFVNGLRFFSLAESSRRRGNAWWRTRPPLTHASMAPEARRVAGISDSLLRLSIGIEDGDDLHRRHRSRPGTRRRGGLGGVQTKGWRMSAVAIAPLAEAAPRTAIVLLGTGVVGHALLTCSVRPRRVRYAWWRRRTPGASTCWPMASRPARWRSGWPRAGRTGQRAAACRARCGRSREESGGRCRGLCHRSRPPCGMARRRVPRGHREQGPGRRASVGLACAAKRDGQAAPSTAMPPPWARACPCFRPCDGYAFVGTACSPSKASSQARYRGCSTSTTAAARSHRCCAMRGGWGSPSPIRVRTSPAKTWRASC